jgi:hypothetical protein
MRVEEKPLMREGAPPRFDHGVGELQFREGQTAAQHARGDQVVDVGIHVLDARVRQQDRRRFVGTGAHVSATRHAKIRREQLSITACREARVPSSK